MRSQMAEMTALGAMVRAAEQPDQPRLLQRYLQLVELQAGVATAPVQRQLYLQAFHNLLDTICDCCLPRHWRCLCLDHIHRPLRAVQRMALTLEQQHQVRQLQAQLRTQSHYFL